MPCMRSATASSRMCGTSPQYGRTPPIQIKSRIPRNHESLPPAGPWLSATPKDRSKLMSYLRHSIRALLKSPGYTFLAVGALALGIGANTVLFSAINTLFLRPLPYPEADRLVRVWGSFNEPGLEQTNLSWPRYQALRDG